MHTAKRSKGLFKKPQKHDAVSIKQAAPADLMEATVAACALIAFADGSLDIKERRKLFTLFQTNPCFTGFSHADVEAEFSRHKRAFEWNPAAARHEVFATLRTFPASVVKAHLILNACREILEADGIEHPKEIAEMEEIRTLLFSELAAAPGRRPAP